MGWTFGRRDYAGQTVEDFVRRDLPDTFARVDRVAMVGSVMYAVYRPRPPFGDIFEPCADGETRIALVILTEGQHGGEVGYKDMDETMGPNEDACPVELLDMLSPLKPDAETYAADWRARCRQRAARAKSSNPPSMAQVAARSQAHTRPTVDQAGLADTPLFGTTSLL